MPSSPRFQLAALAILCLGAYGQAVGRYFVSEDFFVLRQLAASPLWRTVWDNLTGPLLEITFVTFYRPVAAFLLHVEYLIWGVTPAGYHLTHLAIHVLNAALVYRLALRWGAGHRTPAAGVAAIFALYPLHPNALVFVSAYATLFGTAFFLASLVLYEQCRAGGGARELFGSAACFALAAGCYEQTVVLPLFVAARELYDNGGRRRRLSRLSPFVAVLAAYFLARSTALGETVGGYGSFRQRLLDGEAVAIARSLLEGFVRLANPDYDHPVSGTALLIAGLVLLLGSLWGVLRRCVELRLWIFGLLWILATQAPFAFAGVVPGNGRYWYLTSVGLGLTIAAGARLLGAALTAVSPRLKASLVALVVVAAFGLHYWLLLFRCTGVYAEAGRTARNVQGRLEELRDAGHTQVFVTGHPDFVRGPRETPLAQVFHWGLSDALGPPFVDRGLSVYALPPLSDLELLPVVERPDLGTVWRWHPEGGTFSRLALPARPEIERIPVRGSSRGALQYQAVQGSHRLFLLTRANTSVYPADGARGSDGWTRVDLPEPVVDNMRRLYDGEIYAWIEARRDGRLVASSRLQRIETSGGYSGAASTTGARKFPGARGFHFP